MIGICGRQNKLYIHSFITLTLIHVLTKKETIIKVFKKIGYNADSTNWSSEKRIFYINFKPNKTFWYSNHFRALVVTFTLAWIELPSYFHNQNARKFARKMQLRYIKLHSYSNRYYKLILTPSLFTKQAFTCSCLTKETPDQCVKWQWRRSGVVFVNFENMSHIDLTFTLLILNKSMTAETLWPYHYSVQRTFRYSLSDCKTDCPSFDISRGDAKKSRWMFGLLWSNAWSVSS